GKVTFVAVPSTSGTGSEVSRSAVVTYGEQQLKIAFRTPYFIPDVAILDPDLTMSMPPDLVAETGMDAMTHAIESYLNPNADEFTRTLAVGAIVGLFDYLPVSYRDSTPESRAKVHAYQSMAGIAFANSGLGMVHGIAHALGGQYDMGHGLLNAIVLPYALQFDVTHAPDVQAKLDGLARQVGQRDLIQALLDLNQALQIPRTLREASVAAEQFERDLDRLTVNALKGPTASNPVPITSSQMSALLRRVFAGG
ncbi:MAG: iron-containing alcohol dehydrogenase, partial [Erysipelotrichales bacterium]|nr:iron-containing alcohol dehydrogenase [Erysipelotrichales bacterium]